MSRQQSLHCSGLLFEAPGKFCTTTHACGLKLNLCAPSFFAQLVQAQGSWR
jgi:hypothetical protein